jgi:hypothetical protein
VLSTGRAATQNSTNTIPGLDPERSEFNSIENRRRALMEKARGMRRSEWTAMCFGVGAYQLPTTAQVAS